MRWESNSALHILFLYHLGRTAARWRRQQKTERIDVLPLFHRKCHRTSNGTRGADITHVSRPLPDPVDIIPNPLKGKVHSSLPGWRRELGGQPSSLLNMGEYVVEAIERCSSLGLIVKLTFNL